MGGGNDVTINGQTLLIEKDCAMFYIQHSLERGRAMSDELTRTGGDDNYYTLVPEQGLCLVGDDIVNLKSAAVIRKLDGKTLVYYAGAPEPVILPLKAFDQIRDAVFAMDDLDDDEDYDEEDVEEEG